MITSLLASDQNFNRNIGGSNSCNGKNHPPEDVQHPPVGHSILLGRFFYGRLGEKDVCAVVGTGFLWFSRQKGCV